MSSLSEQLAQLADPTPVFKDPEESIDIETKAKLADYKEFELSDEDADLRASFLRKKTVLTLDESDKAYAGKRISRKDLQEDNLVNSDEDSQSADDDHMNEHSNDEDMDIDKFKDIMRNKVADETTQIDEAMFDDDNDEEVDDDETDDDNDDENQSESEKGSEVQDESDDGSVLQKFSKINVADEVEKGQAVKAQLSMWDSLLECRIKMQKLLMLVNQLPQTETWSTFAEKSDHSYQSSLTDCQEKTRELMNCLLNMQTQLLDQNPETKHVTSSDDPQIKHCTAAIGHHKATKRLSAQQYDAILQKRHKTFKQFRNESIQKWGDKTRIASGKLSHKSFAGFDQSAVKQINQILSDRPRLVKRTQLKRTAFHVLGKVEDDQSKVDDAQLVDRSDQLQSYDSEIFDDGDFYHQLLRELIERKTADVNNPIALGKQWLEIQKLRGKLKKKVDTKASKGRKIRYNVMTKLVNFMAPIAENSMTDQAKNELFSSLFGKLSQTDAAQ